MTDSLARLKRDRYPYRILLHVVPLHALQVLRYELNMLWIRTTRPRTDRRFAGSSALLVNVGCGTNGRHGWVNVDSADAPGVTCIYDCRKRIPLPRSCSRAVFSEHLLEHLDYEEEAPVFLAECRRVLQPGGVLRIVVPDGRRYLLAYAKDDWAALRAFSPLVISADGGFSSRMEVINAHFRQGGQHRFSYDYETLHLLLARCGFEDIRLHSFNESRFADLAIDDPSRATESLYVEAVRP